MKRYSLEYWKVTWSGSSELDMKNSHDLIVYGDNVVCFVHEFTACLHSQGGKKMSILKVTERNFYSINYHENMKVWQFGGK